MNGVLPQPLGLGAPQCMSNVIRREGAQGSADSWGDLVLI